MFELINNPRESAQGLWQHALAERFVNAAQSWTRHLAVAHGLQNDGIHVRLMNQMMAYGLSLLEIQDRQVDPILQACLKEAYDEAMLAMKTDAFQKESTCGDADSFSQSTGQYLAKTLPDTGITEESLRLFHLATGLDASVLVGGGSNLATLVFYIVVFSHFASLQRPGSQHHVELLDEIKDCAAHLREIITHVPGQTIGSQALVGQYKETIPQSDGLGHPSEYKTLVANRL